LDWQSWIGPAVGLAGLLFAVYVYNKNQKPKRLQYEVRIDQEIISHSRYARWADLSVRFGDRDLKRPRVVVVRVINTGKVEARSEDFDEPLAVVASRGVEIIAATIAHRKTDAEESQDVKPASIDVTEVVAPKILLNEGEWLEFRLLVEGERKPVRLQVHAAGFRLTTYAPRTSLFASPVLPFATAILAVSAVISTLLPLPWNTARVPNVVGKPIDQAVSQINDAGLKLGTLNTVRGAKAGTVISASPVAGKRVDRNSQVTLVISSGP
jgi:PASTA domain